jgi:hypothetical protein
MSWTKFIIYFFALPQEECLFFKTLAYLPLHIIWHILITAATSKISPIVYGFTGFLIRENLSKVVLQAFDLTFKRLTFTYAKSYKKQP